MPLIITRQRSEPYWESVKEMKIQNNKTLNQFQCQKDPIDETKRSHNNNVLMASFCPSSQGISVVGLAQQASFKASFETRRFMIV